MRHVIASWEQLGPMSFAPVPTLRFKIDGEEHELRFTDPRALAHFWFDVHELMCSVVDTEGREVDLHVAKVTSRVDPKWCDGEFEAAVV